MNALMAFGQWLEHTSFASAIDDTPHALSVISIAHYFSFFIVIGTSVLVDLRLLGVAGRRQKVAEFAGQFLPWTWASLAVAALSGFLMFVPDATTFLNIHFFSVKMIGLFAAIVVVAVIHMNVRKWDQSPSLPGSAKLAGGLSLALWVGTLISALEIAQYANI